MRTRTRKYDKKSSKPSTRTGAKHRNHKSTAKKIELVYKNKKLLKKQGRPTPIKLTAKMYEVEEIVAAKQTSDGPKYLVKWEGYDSSHNAWIDEMPPFFKKRCLFLIGKGSVSEIDSSDSSDSSESESESESDNDDTVVSDSESEESAIESDSDSIESDSDQSTTSDDSDGENECDSRHCCRCHCGRS
jgi:hypothetical protein